MSHSKIRTEKVCLNCGTQTTGRYCPVCGQENTEPKQTVWHLVNHFFSDITHFDGKFFTTVKDLFAKPGFLSREYMIGRRVSYLDPIRMYIFTSAFVLLIFFSVLNAEHIHVGGDKLDEIKKDPELRELMATARTYNDSMKIIRDYNRTSTPFVKISDDTAHRTGGVRVSVEDTKYKTIAAYDSAQHFLPPEKRDGWIMRKLKIKNITIKQRFDADPGGMIKIWMTQYQHNFPKVLFISLPVFALILKLIYIRHKNFYYTDHGIFSVHLYIFTFLVILVLLGLNEFINMTGFHVLNWLLLVIVVYPFVYYYLAMYKFYGQSAGKTLLNYLILFVLTLVFQVVIFIGAFFFSVIEV